MARRQGAPTGRTGRRPLAACGETQAAFERRCIPAEPLRFAPFCVAFRSKYTRYSSLTRLVSRAPRRSRRSPGFHHRLLGRHSPPQAGGGKNLQFRAGARRSGYCDMFPSNRLRYCDMFPPSRPRYCDMFTPQIELLRHVRAQPTPLLRHVHPTDRATATCSHPADPVTATCSLRRSGYCDMFPSNRPRYCDMFTPQIGLLRHVRAQPTPLLRHVHPADRATATCPSPGRLVRNGVAGQRRRAVTGGNLQLDFSTLPPRRRKNGGRFPSE